MIQLKKLNQNRKRELKNVQLNNMKHKNKQLKNIKLKKTLVHLQKLKDNQKLIKNLFVMIKLDNKKTTIISQCMNK